MPLAMILGLLAAVMLARAGWAQGPAPLGSALLEGRIHDSVSQAPIIRGVVCRIHRDTPSRPTARCTSADATGRYRLDSLSAGMAEIEVRCESRRIFPTRLLLVTLPLASGERRTLDVPTSASGCEQRPLAERSGRFAGYYTYGFEESRFRSADGSFSNAWVVDTLDEPSTRRWNWPRVTERDPYPCTYVEWDGILRGPGHYGHLGVSEYELVVVRIHRVRRAPAERCASM